MVLGAVGTAGEGLAGRASAGLAAGSRAGSAGVAGWAAGALPAGWGGAPAAGLLAKSGGGGADLTRSGSMPAILKYGRDPPSLVGLSDGLSGSRERACASTLPGAKACWSSKRDNIRTQRCSPPFGEGG